MSEPPKTPDDESRAKAPLLPPVEDEDETEMTSVMGSEERKVLLEAARTEAEREMATPLSQRKEDLERATARPPPEPAGEVVAIPKAAALPKLVVQEDRPAADQVAPPADEPADEPIEKPAAKAAASAAEKPAAARDPGAMETWALVAFVLLAAAVAFALMR